MRRVKTYPQEVENKMKAHYESLNEKERRRYAAIEALKLGYGGQDYIRSILGCHIQTVKAGIIELSDEIEHTGNRIRRPGGGKKKIIDTEENIWNFFRNFIG